MPRSFSPRELIQLPRMDAWSLEACGRALLAQYRPHAAALRKTKVAPAAGALDKGVKALALALAQRAAQPGETASQREAAALDPTVDATWAALVMFLEAWARLNWRDEGRGAQAILDQVFPDRLKFTQQKFFAQWSDANARLAQLHAARDDGAPSHAAQIERLGGEAFLGEIQDKHGAFGRALGLTEATRAPVAADVRAAYDELLGRCKDYVAAVMLLDAREVPDPETLRNELLFVIEQFESDAPRGEKKGGGDNNTGGTPADGQPPR